MALPWTVVDSFKTEDEGTLELRRRGERDFLITFGGLVLMNSRAQRSEMALGRLGCAGLNGPAPRVLVGGLGMGCTLRAVLDELPPAAHVVVAELNERIALWCRGPLADLTAGAALDERVQVRIDDVAHVIAAVPSAERFDAIILDLYRGPEASDHKIDDPFYGTKAIENARQALTPGGTLAVWGEAYDQAFHKRLGKGGFTVRVERPGKGGYRHAVYLGKRV